MEDNHTDVGQFQEAQRRRIEARPAEKSKRRERISITEWMAQTLAEMKRQVGWFKENPEVTRVRQMAGEYPALREEVEIRLTKVERQADQALQEATEELRTVIESSTPIEVIQPERFVIPVSVDFMDLEAWQNFKYALINDFEQLFGQAAPAEGDFEVTLSAPLSTTTLGEAKERGPQPVRVRSESVGGVRVDAFMSPPDSKKISEFRIYDLNGYYIAIPGNEDPVDMLIGRARTNQITFQNWIKAEERARERKRILLGAQSKPSATSKYELPITLDHLVQKHLATLGSPEEYAQRGERMFKTTEMKGGKGPEVGPLTTPTRAEPAVSFGETAADWVGTEPEIEPRVDQFAQAMVAKYGKEVGSRLSEQLFANQTIFDDYFKAWESATHNTTLKPAQQNLIRQVFAGLQAEGKEQGLAGKGSHTYLVEAYRNIEHNLPKLLESTQSVKELMDDPTTTRAELTTYQKELNYLNHLKIRIEQNPKRTLHRAVEEFLEKNQYLLTLGEIRQILEADQALDDAEQVDDAREKVAKAMDYPARMVLDKRLKTFIQDYGRFMPREKALFEQKREDLRTQEMPINFWDEELEVTDAMSKVKRRAWDKITVESFTRVNQVLQHYGNTMDDKAFPVVSRLQSELQKSIPSKPGTGLEINAMQDILRRFEPIEFERYVTSLLHAATGLEMQPDWQKPEAEMRPPASEAVKNETWIHEPDTGIESVPPTPVMVEEFEEEEYEDVSGEIPDLVRQLRSVQGIPENARLAAIRTREILDTAGSEKMIDVTRPMLQKMDNLKSNGYIKEKVYQRALATLLSADNFNDREQAITDLQADLPLPMMHQPGKMRLPTEEFPTEKELEKRETA
ncbi:MAG: hypothetical protein AAB558_04185 [Patescibacteria group bacterium]